MSDLAFLQRNILDVGAAIARCERALAESGSSPSLLSMLGSLHEQREALEEEFQLEASALGADVCAYTLLPDFRQAPQAAGVGRALDRFQSLVTVVHAAVSGGRPRVRAGPPPTGTTQPTSFGFAYTYTGSLGIMLTLDNDRLLLGDSKLDESLELVFEMAKASSSSEVASYATRLGPASVRFLYQWMSSHLDISAGVDIRWMRSGEIRSRVLVQPPEFWRLRTAIESTSEAIIERVNLSGLLVGLDVQRRSFRAAFDDGGYLHGTLAEPLVVEEPILVPYRYIFNLKKIVTTNYATDVDKTGWELEGLNLEAPAEPSR